MYFIYIQSDQRWVRLASFPARFVSCFLSFVIFPMKEPGPRDPFLERPANFRVPKLYTQIQA